LGGGVTPNGAAQRPPDFWDFLHAEYKERQLDEEKIYTIDHEC